MLSEVSLFSPWLLVGAASVPVVLAYLYFRRRYRRAIAWVRARAHLDASDVEVEVQRVMNLSEQRLRDLMDLFPSGVALAGLDGTLEVVNARFCELLARPASDLVGKPLSDFTHRDDRAEDRRLARSLVRGDVRSYTRIKRYERAGGESVFVRVHVTLLPARGEEPPQLAEVAEEMPQAGQAHTQPASPASPAEGLDAGPATLAPPQPAAARPVAAAPIDPAKVSGTVLYIEDNEPNVMVMRDLLAVRPNVRLEVVGTAAAGLEAIRTLRPDLVLLDWQLPDSDGLQVLLQVAVQEGPRPPIVVLSANAMYEYIQAALDAGAAHYLTKPLDAMQLLNLVDGMLTGQAGSGRAAPGSTSRPA